MSNLDYTVNKILQNLQRIRRQGRCFDGVTCVFLWKKSKFCVILGSGWQQEITLDVKSKIMEVFYVRIKAYII